MIYEKIKEIASKKDISINKIEKTLGFGSSTISKWNKSAPAVDKLKKVADYLQVDINVLLSDEQVTH